MKFALIIWYRSFETAWAGMLLLRRVTPHDVLLCS